MTKLSLFINQLGEPVIANFQNKHVLMDSRQESVRWEHELGAKIYCNPKTAVKGENGITSVDCELKFRNV